MNTVVDLPKQGHAAPGEVAPEEPALPEAAESGRAGAGKEPARSDADAEPDRKSVSADSVPQPAAERTALEQSPALASVRTHGQLRESAPDASSAAAEAPRSPRSANLSPSEGAESSREEFRPGNQLDLQLEGQRGERVRIRLWDAAGSVRLRMTASEEHIAEALRTGWPQLERALEKSGWNAEAAPVPPHRAQEAAAARHPGLAQDEGRTVRGSLAPLRENSSGTLFSQDHPAGGRRHDDAREEWIDLSALRRLGAWRQS